MSKAWLKAIFVNVKPPKKLLTMKFQLGRTLLIAVVAFLLAVVVDEETNFEARLGLDTLFKLRPNRKPPDDVVIVTIDEHSDAAYGLGTDISQWRSKHAGLIKSLKDQGVALVVFDLFFSNPQPEIDTPLAEAMAEAGNVIAGECVLTQKNGWGLCGNRPIPNQPVQVYQPVPALEQAMLDNGAFPASKDTGNYVLRQSWTFLETKPTLPILAWFHWLNIKKQLQKVVQPNQPLSQWLSEQRGQCPLTTRKNVLSESEHDRLGQRINDLICRGSTRFLDFYGPPKTFKMLSYSDVRDGKATQVDSSGKVSKLNLKDKIVFVGLLPRRTQPYIDSFITPLTTTESGEMAGVEVMATHFANILEGREVTQPTDPALTMLAFGVLISFLLTTLPGRKGGFAGVLFSGLYFGLAFWCFQESGTWLPIAAPFLQFSVALVMSLCWSYWDEVIERQRLAKIIIKLTGENKRLINRLIDPEKNPNFLSKPLNREGGSDKLGVCLATDIEGYTELARRTDNTKLRNLLEDYYEVLGEVVSEHGGKVANIAGDGMIAVWVDQPIETLQLLACKAAIQGEQALSRFNATLNGETLVTRFGLHKGGFAMGPLGGVVGKHNPIGYDINIASRIEAANKKLGTRILASQSVVIGINTIMNRPIGAFLLKGVEESIEIAEIVGIESEVCKPKRQMLKRFANGLKAFRAGKWYAAHSVFTELFTIEAGDGPTKFYKSVAKTYQETPPSDWQGYIDLETIQGN